MRLRTIIVALIILLVAPSYQFTNTSPTEAPVEIEEIRTFETVENQIMEGCEESEGELLARSGCCSWHRGVCGCDTATDRIRCCDGTLSPSCRCSTY
jgi:hypothetical protein